MQVRIQPWSDFLQRGEPERQRHAKIAYEMADRLQRSADGPRWNKSERQTIEEWAEDQEMTFAQAIRRLVELGLKVKGK